VLLVVLQRWWRVGWCRLALQRVLHAAQCGLQLLQQLTGWLAAGGAAVHVQRAGVEAAAGSQQRPQLRRCVLELLHLHAAQA
jgi:hypothetical protein